MPGAIMKYDEFWNATERDAFWAKRGTKLKKIRDLLKSHKGDRSAWDTSEIEALANALATYAHAKNWSGSGPIGARDQGAPGVITRLMGQVDEHLTQQGLQSVRKRLGFPDPVAPRRMPPAPPPRAQVLTAPPTNLAPPTFPPTHLPPPHQRATPPLPPPRTAPPLPPPRATPHVATNPPPQHPPTPPPRNPPPPVRHVAPPPPPQLLTIAAPKKAPTSDAAIQQSLKALDAARNFACRDAVSFFSCVKGYKQGTPQPPPTLVPKPDLTKWQAEFLKAQDPPFAKIWERAKTSGGSKVTAVDSGAVLATAARGAQFNEAIARRRQAVESSGPKPQSADPFHWDERKVKDAHDMVVKEKAGECTSFGWFGAHILSNAEVDESARVELVVWEKQGKTGLVTHVYCIVNRDGDYSQVNTPRGPRRQLPPMKDWKGKWWIVDPWAGSLGHEIVYERGRGYPFGGMVEPLFLEMVYDD